MSFIAKLHSERRRELAGVLILSTTILLFLALLTDDIKGSSIRSVTQLSEVPNLLGEPGAVTAGVLYVLLGHGAHILYFLFGIWGCMLIAQRNLDRLPLRALGLVFLAGATSGLLHLNFSSESTRFPGGALGAFTAHLIEPYLGPVGGTIVIVTAAIVGLLLSTEFLIAHIAIVAYRVSRVVFSVTGAMTKGLLVLLLARPEGAADQPRKRQKAARNEKETETAKIPDFRPSLMRKLKRMFQRRSTRERDRINVQEIASAEGASGLVVDAKAEPVTVSASGYENDDNESGGSQLEFIDEEELLVSAPERRPTLRRKRKKIEATALPPDYVYPKRYTKPSIDMFEKPVKRSQANLTEVLRKTGVLLEQTLETFGIEATVTDITRGPTITRFELEPAPGVKVSRFLALADDLALALKAHRVRVEAPIPGKGRVGIEVPNSIREPVVVRELLESKGFTGSYDALPLAFGKDIAGDVITADMATMPHLLVAGATGAGKTIFVKTVLTSLLFKHHPDELQLMMIDPKMVELSIFNDIPHLITPVVIDPKKASSALNWLISEMEERYRHFADLGVRNIEVYNDSVENGEIEIEDSDGESVTAVRKLPYIVCIIDELADLMMLARAEVEDAIGRLAQLARAVGIHLIIATQRPSVDVLTGVIKANFPCRVSFQVSSRVDSRCILDEIGAERLIGRGDMLYLPAGQAKPLRVQGAFVSDEEVNALIAYLKTQAPPQYRDEIENFGKQKDGLADLADENDELFDDAVRVVMETGQASISMVQRRLRVGYTRAARLVDMMELKGIVGPHTGSKAREILVSTTAADNDEVA